jgi:hypothetical protein
MARTDGIGSEIVTSVAARCFHRASSPANKGSTAPAPNGDTAYDFGFARDARHTKVGVAAAEDAAFFGTGLSTGGFLIAGFFAVAFFARSSAHRCQVASPIRFLAAAFIKRLFRSGSANQTSVPSAFNATPVGKSACASSFWRPFMSTS